MTENHGHDDRADRLEREIGDIQARLSETAYQIRRRLAPRQLKERVRSMYRSSDTSHDPSRHEPSGRDGQSGMGGMIRNNAMPLAVIGLGLGWIMMSNTQAGHRMARPMQRLRSRAGHAAEDVRHRVQSAAETVRHSAEDIRHRATDTMQSATQRTRSTSPGSSETGSYTQGFWQMVDDHPVVAGLMGMALGAAVGASLPHTEAEDRWMGDIRDDVMEKTRDLSREAADRAAEVAEAGVTAARREATQQSDQMAQETAGTGI